MTKNTNTSMRRFAAKCLWIWGMVMAFVASAEAENKVTIDNFNIKVDEEKTISVYLENSDPMVGLQMDFKLPKGLDFVPNSVQRDEVRLSRSSHSIYMNEVQSSMEDMAKGIKTVRLLIQPNGIYNIAGDRGAVAYFKVRANENMVETSEIVLDNIVGSSSEFDEETGNIKGYHLDSYTAHVSPNVGFFYLTEDSICVKNDGSVKKVSLGLRNYTSVRGMEAVLSLPEGLSLDTEANGAPKFEYGERLPQNLSISSSILEDGRTKLVLSGLTSETLKGDTGVVFSFFVKASETFQEVAELSLDEIILSDDAGHGIDMEGKLVMKVINSFIAYYTPANDSIQGLRTRYEAAVEKINTEAANVKDSAIVVNAVQEVATRIEDLQKSVNEAYANETLATVYDEVLAPVVEIDTAIVDMVEMVLDYQQKVTANEEAYTRLTADIAAVQAKLDAAKTTIETDYAEVAEQFTADIAALQEDIDSISNEVKGLYDEVKLTAESQIDATAIETGIEKVLADAAAALATEEAKKANEEAYTRLTADIAAVQAKLDAAKTTIETDYAEVAEQFTADIAALQEDIDSISNEVKGLYDEVKLTAESQIDATAIETGIEKVLADAKKAHEGSNIAGVKGPEGAELLGIYTVSGKRVAAPLKGQVNIFKYSDGTVKKFYMK
ncbi:MAG: hypothetical protein KH071_01275 [Paraprevotella sp.]|jgi:endonuclease/exonuclease/phosphatase family metal-dependent hydrolase|uniref:hypothetical protein n=1 Tax=Paraprevotella sp. TaxID=2049036 RepID=UPI00257B9CE1|nr:hypothetical protein [Paraprevotella sp.]MBS4806528.1 hypothetical protein [Paraprevotella sp.]